MSLDVSCPEGFSSRKYGELQYAISFLDALGAPDRAASAQYKVT